jgi:hypothetical protein
MKQRDELVSVLDEIKINLKNERILNILKHNNFDIEALKSAIEKYLDDKYIFKDDALYDKVYSKSKELLEFTNSSSFSNYIHNFINASNFIVEYSNNLVPLTTNISNINEKIPKLRDYMFDDRRFLQEFKKIESLEEEKLKMKGQLQELNEKYDKSKKDFELINDIIQNASNLEVDYKNAKETVLKDLKLQVSYNYWEKQVVSYTNKYWAYFIVSIIVAIILICSVFIFLKNNPLVINSTNTELIVVKIASDINNTINNVSEENAFQLWEYGFLILVTTMGIWLIRILIKITLSNYHLSVDANERVIMIKTYLSLLKEGSGFEPNDKKVMLDNIFRPTNFGIIKDETSVTIADILSSLKK